MIPTGKPAVVKPTGIWTLGEPVFALISAAAVPAQFLLAVSADVAKTKKIYLVFCEIFAESMLVISCFTLISIDG